MLFFLLYYLKKKIENTNGASAVPVSKELSTPRRPKLLFLDLARQRLETPLIAFLPHLLTLRKEDAGSWLHLDLSPCLGPWIVRAGLPGPVT